jgi:hypothetical protein
LRYTSWPDMYNQYVRNYEKMNEFFYGYGERWKAVNELFVEASQNYIKLMSNVENCLKLVKMCML